MIDVLEDRRLNNLKHYFLRFPLEERKEIRFVVSDFYWPYRSLSKALFPNVEVVIDRFHITRLINQTLMNHRIQVMNRLKIKA
ncbi:transposase [Enterococcus raffinosus]|nr:transposase [Enterococcus raffinosus]